MGTFSRLLNICSAVNANLCFSPVCERGSFFVNESFVVFILLLVAGQCTLQFHMSSHYTAVAGTDVTADYLSKTSGKFD